MPKQVTDVDRQIGKRIATLRATRKISQTVLGKAIGVTFQQVQKYEKGQNRIGAGKLAVIAEILEVSVGELYAESGVPGTSEQMAEIFEHMEVIGAMDLLRNFSRIEDVADRAALVKVAASMAPKELAGAA